MVRLGKTLDEDCVKQLEEAGYDYEKCLDFLGLYVKVIREFAESEPREFNKKLLLLGHSEEFVNNCNSLLPQLQLDRAVLFDKLTAFKWRLDISFFDRFVHIRQVCLGSLRLFVCCSKSLEKIPMPIIISLKTNRGKKYVIELDRKAFHKLRFTVAVLIKDLLNVKTANSLKM